MAGYKGPRFWFRFLELQYLMREQTKALEILEIGSGTLELATKLSKDHKVSCIDMSSELSESYDALPNDQKANITCLFGDFLEEDLGEDRYDMVIALEVLEHIEDEARFLLKLKKVARENCLIYLSVPAHSSLWSKHDEMVGHQRRYDRSDIKRIRNLFNYYEVNVYGYGWPWINLLRIIRVFSSPLFYRGSKTLSKKERSIRSGQRFTFLNVFSLISNKYIIYPFWLLSRLFVNTDLSEGYIIEIKK